MDWDNILPASIAREQRAWERRDAARRMRAVGMIYAEIGRRLNVGKPRAREIVIRAEREKGHSSPAELYINGHLGSPNADIKRLKSMSPIASGYRGRARTFATLDFANAELLVARDWLRV